MDETLSSKQAPNPAECDLSVIIPNLNSPIIDRVVQSVLEQQTALVFEIIVVGMDQPQLIPTDPRVQIIDTAVPTPAAMPTHSPTTTGLLFTSDPSSPLILCEKTDCAYHVNCGILL